MTTTHQGLILSPFDKRWSSGIDWAVEFHTPKKAAKAQAAQPPNYREPKLTVHKPPAEPRKPSKYKPKSERRPQSESKTAKIRAMLAKRGPMSRRELASAMDMPAVNVTGLIQHDLRLGRIRKDLSKKPIEFVLIGPAA